MSVDLVDLLRRSGPLRARDVLEQLRVSQPTLSRLAARAGDAVVRIGRARATRYAALRRIEGVGQAWPVYRVDPLGKPQAAGRLVALHPRGFWYDTSMGRAPSWLRGEFADGILPGLPWFLEDARPQGFLGRAFARRHAAELRVAPDPQRWSDEMALQVLLGFGSDLPGDFLVGDAALEQFHRLTQQPAVIAGRDRPDRYDAMATAAIAGELPGSSAGGEQPKFTATIEGQRGFRHVLVKFTPPRDSAVGERWNDLLLCEHLASQALAAGGLTSCETTWLESETRGYLEVTRFDRAGASGRLGVVSLFALDASHRGALDDWYSAADWLAGDGWISGQDAEHLRVLWWVGRFIANADMHFGNVSFRLDSTLPLSMLPAYDMLPMQLRPAVSGELSPLSVSMPVPPPSQLASASRAAGIAARFWRSVAADRRISGGMRTMAAVAGDDVMRSLDRAR